VEEERVRKIDVSKELEKTFIFKEMNWRQITSFVVEGGGQKRQFFHRVANSNRKFNYVDSLNINGAMSKNPMKIKKHIVHFFNKLYSE
jgi:hypothetical protein